MPDKLFILTKNTIQNSIQKVFKTSKGHISNLQANLHNRNWYVNQLLVWRQNGVNLQEVLGGGTARLNLRCQVGTGQNCVYDGCERCRGINDGGVLRKPLFCLML